MLLPITMGPSMLRVARSAIPSQGSRLNLLVREGEKVPLTSPFIWEMVVRLEELTLKAWRNSELHRNRMLGKKI